jgi:hypothetical protein
MPGGCHGGRARLVQVCAWAASASRWSLVMREDGSVDLRKARFVRTALIPATVVALAACTPSSDGEHAAPSSAPVVQVHTPETHTLTLPSTDPAELALTASQALFAKSGVVIVAGLDDDVAAPALTAVASALHAPALLADGPGDRSVRSEAERLGARAAVVVEDDRGDLAVDGASPAPSDAESTARDAGLRVVTVDPDMVVPGGAADGSTTGAPDDSAVALDRRRLDELQHELGDALSATEPTLLTEVLALVDPQPGQDAALATLRAAGAVTETVAGGDPGADADTIRTLDEAQALTVLGVGPAFADPDVFAWQVGAAEDGKLLPTGTQRVLPARFAAASATLGQPPDRILAATDSDEDAPPGDHVVPALALRASTRQWSAGPDGDYLRAESVDDLAPTVDAALHDGRYVVLELQGGSVTLLDQVRALEPLLEKGGVGVLVHPEQRRSGAGLARGGRVPADELQAVVDYLTTLVSKSELPQMLLAVRDLASAVDDADSLTSHPQVAVLDASVLEGIR